jgi:hypothetical protein
MERTSLELSYLRLCQLLVLLYVLLGAACSKDNTPVGLTGQQQTFPLQAAPGQPASGTVIFRELTDATTRIDIELTGATSGNTYPARLYFNSLAEGGTIAVDLGNIDGATGRSSVTVSKLRTGAPVTYALMAGFDGHVVIHPSPSDLVNVWAAGDIGGNELTGEFREYPLHEQHVTGASGNVRVEQRRNGNSLITIAINGSTPGVMHPAHLHRNTAAQDGALVKDLNPVDGTSGISRTTLKTLEDNSPLPYNDFINFNGFIRIHYSAGDMNRILAVGDIGSNAP